MVFIPGIPITHIGAVRDAISNTTSSFGVSTPASIYDSSAPPPPPDMASQLTSVLIMVLAIYLALKCKKNGNIEPLQIVLALCCSPCYVVYRLFKPCY